MLHQCCVLPPAVRKDVRLKKMYSGSMRITNQVFEDAYENSNSSEFKALAKQVNSQVRLLLELTFQLICVYKVIFLLFSSSIY